MNSIITLKRLVELVAKTSGSSTVFAEDFVRAFTGIVRSGLLSGSPVQIDGIGTFAYSATDPRKVVFTPDAALAEAINAPFAMFAAEELAPGLTADALQDMAQTEAPTPAAVTPPALEERQAPAPKAETPAPEPQPVVEEPEPQSVIEEPEPQPIVEEPELPAEEPQAEAPTVETETPASAVEPELPTVKTPVTTPAPAVEPQPFAPPAPQPATPPAPKPVTPPAISEPEDETPQASASYEGYEQPERPFPFFWVSWAAVIGLIIGLAVGFLVHDPIAEILEPSLAEGYESEILVEEADAPVVEPDTTAADSIGRAEIAKVDAPAASAAPAQVETPEPAPKPAAAPKAEEKVVYDTVRPSYFLTHMASRHYGVKEYWVYIYLENQDVIKDPNRLQNGLKVRIPDISKYAKSSSQAENIAEARRRIAEVNKKFGK